MDPHQQASQKDKEKECYRLRRAMTPLDMYSREGATEKMEESMIVSLLLIVSCMESKKEEEEPKGLVMYDRPPKEVRVCESSVSSSHLMRCDDQHATLHLTSLIVPSGDAHPHIYHLLLLSACITSGARRQRPDV